MEELASIDLALRLPVFGNLKISYLQVMGLTELFGEMGVFTILHFADATNAI